jgi:hypothetical protein
MGQHNGLEASWFAWTKYNDCFMKYFNGDTIRTVLLKAKTP